MEVYHSSYSHMSERLQITEPSHGADSKTPQRAVQQNSQQIGESQSQSNDVVSISPEGRGLSRDSLSEQNTDTRQKTDEQSQSLSAQDQAKLLRLAQRDTEVRRHEQAHLAAAGGYATGGPSFTFQKGPDGNSYAVGGEVGIDVAKESTPEATISKMETIQRAALAPAQPSSADRQIAARASVTEAQARQEILAQRQQELLEGARSTFLTSVQGFVNPEPSHTISNPQTGPAHSAFKHQIAAYNSLARNI